GSDLAAPADVDPGALEIAHEVVRHRFAEVGATVEERHDRPAAGEPDRRLGRRVPAADDPDASCGAATGLLRPRGVEDADSLVRLDPGNGEAAVLGAGCEDDGARPDLLAALETDGVVLDARLERDRTVRRGHPGAELPRLADSPDCQLRAADAC